MDKRLRLAKNLLKDSGVIFISIDDNEQAQLKLLCDEIFGEENFVANVIWQHSLQAKGYAGKISLHHNYTFIYKKSNSFSLGLLERTDEHNVSYSNPDNDPKGLWRSGDVRNALVRKNLMYDIESPSGNIIKHPPKGWRFSYETFKKELGEGKIIFSHDETRIIRKIYLADQDGRVPESIWFGKEVGTTRDGTQILKDIFDESMVFDSPKPIPLIQRILQIGASKSARVLDFFAGSGTTLHAVMALNAEDGGNRECILVTNNENNICEEVTYERNKRVIQGYQNAKGEPVAGLSGNNLRYYKTGYVGREKTLANKRALMALATEMLCLKEGVYEEKNLQGLGDLTGLGVRIFQENGKAFMVVYDDTHIPQAVSIIQALSAELLPNALKVYVFSEGQDPYTEDFAEVAEWIQLVALPDAIYRAYQHLLPSPQ